ncbi:MAG: HAD-IA family hydrolase [Clostridiales bacterium]|nr:HAD-IA family hydrolase [Clostridiales bacterium]
MAKINTVIFDFDGTIMNTNDVVIKSWQHTFRTIEGKERPVESIIATFGEPLYVTMEKMFPEIPVEEAVEIYRSYLRENFNEMIEPFPGMVELVQKVKEMDYKTGLVTSRVGDTTRQGLEKFGLAPYIDCLVTCDDTDKHKPHPEPLNIALNKLCSRNSESIMLGDTMFDILCAKNAGVKSVLVGWQVAVSKDEIEGPNGPDYIIEKPEDLFEIISTKE